MLPQPSHPKETCRYQNLGSFFFLDKAAILHTSCPGKTQKAIPTFHCLPYCFVLLNHNKAHRTPHSMPSGTKYTPGNQDWPQESTSRGDGKEIRELVYPHYCSIIATFLSLPTWPHIFLQPPQCALPSRVFNISNSSSLFYSSASTLARFYHFFIIDYSLHMCPHKDDAFVFHFVFLFH